MSKSDRQGAKGAKNDEKKTEPEQGPTGYVGATEGGGSQPPPPIDKTPSENALPREGQKPPVNESAPPPPPDSETMPIEVKDDGAKARLVSIRPATDIFSVGRRGPGGEPKRYRITWRPNPPDDEDLIPVTIELRFQNGTLLENGSNGLTNEALLEIVADRLEWFQKGPYPCKQNEHALARVREALAWLDERTRDRVRRQVEGQYLV